MWTAAYLVMDVLCGIFIAGYAIADLESWNRHDVVMQGIICMSAIIVATIWPVIVVAVVVRFFALEVVDHIEARKEA